MLRNVLWVHVEPDPVPNSLSYQATHQRGIPQTPLSIMRWKTCAIASLLVAACSHALDNGVARTPPRGFSTWNAFPVHSIDEATARRYMQVGEWVRGCVLCGAIPSTKHQARVLQHSPTCVSPASAQITTLSCG